MVVTKSDPNDSPVEIVESSALTRGAGGSLSRRDPLTAYMRDVQRYEVLSPEEQQALAIRFREDGDMDAARRLVTSNLRLVVKIAYGYRQAYRNILDLVQEGNIGLMQAVQKYDPYKGVKLSSYAAWWIRAYILRFVLNNARLVKLGTTQAQRKLFFNLNKEKARLTAMGIDPTAERIAESLDVSTADVTSMEMRLASGDTSLDVPVGNEEGRQVSHGEMLAGFDVPADEMLADAEIDNRFSSKIHEFGDKLRGKDRVIFDKRLISDEPLTLQELGTEFGVSRERVRQLEKRLLGQMKDYLRSELGESIIEVYEAT